MADIIITKVGLEALVNAQQNGTEALVLSTVQFGSGRYTPTGNETALQSSFKSLTTISGGEAGDNVIHITISDTDAEAYTVYEVGVFTSTGVLFAIASQQTPIIQKASTSQALLSLDFVVESAGSGDIVLGDTDFFNPPATTELQGVVELATAAEAAAGVDSTRAVTPAALAKAGAAFDDASIPGSKVANGGISTGKLAVNAVTAEKITNAAVVTAKLADGSVTEPKIATNAVTSAKIAASAVVDGKIAAAAVNTANIKDLNVTSEKIAAGAVTSEKIAAGAVGTSQIEDKAVTGAKLAEIEVNDLPQSLLDALMPAGEFVICAGKTLPPRTLLCNGAAVSRTSYARLFAAIGTLYGEGDGSTTFNLPNLNGRVMQGTNDLAQVGKYLEAQLPRISGSVGWVNSQVNARNVSGSLYWAYEEVGGVTEINFSKNGMRDIAFDASCSSSVYSGATLQPASANALVCVRF